MKCLLTSTGTFDSRLRYGYRCVSCNRVVYSRYSDSNFVSVICSSKPTLLVSSSTGPGTELKNILKELDIVEFAGCNCKDKIKKMDTWGVAGCQKNFNTIREWIVEAQKKADWLTTITAAIKATTTGIALLINPTDIAGSLVKIAIERATKDPESGSTGS